MTQTVLIIGSVWPEPDSSAAGTRMLQLLSLLSAMHFEIVFVSTASDSDYMIDSSGLELSANI